MDNLLMRDVWLDEGNGKTHATVYLEDGHIFEVRSFRNPITAIEWAQSWASPVRTTSLSIADDMKMLEGVTG